MSVRRYYQGELEGLMRTHPHLQRSFSSSEEDLKSTPEYGSDDRDSEKGKP